MKIGIFSGTFDPIHVGHIGFTEAAQEELGLDKIVFLPETKPRRKNHVTAPEKRQRMLKLATENKPWADVYVCSQDSHEVGKTMQEIHEKFGKDNQYFILMGTDIYEHIEKWRNYQKLINGNQIVLALRTEDDGELAIGISQRLKISPKMIISPVPNISSTAIRNMHATEFLNEKVAKYIEENNLYVQ